MPTPRKSAAVLSMQDTSHKTKREIAKRKKAEQGALTGTRIKESEQTKNNELAHKEFLHMRKIMQSTGKDDDIYGNAVNRYCMLSAECLEFVQKREHIFRELQDFCEKKDDMVENEELTFREAYRIETEMQRNMLSIDKQIQTKRKFMLDIEKENGWTVKASLQTIPVKKENTGGAMSSLKEALSGGG